MVQFSVAFVSSQKRKKTKEWSGATKAPWNNPCPVSPSVGDARDMRASGLNTCFSSKQILHGAPANVPFIKEVEGRLLLK